MQITTIGLDIAKNVFQVHGIDAAEKVVVRKQLRRSKVIAFFEALPPCLVGMEACASALYPLAFYARAGGLVSYGIDVPSQFQQGAGYVDRLLLGAKPADL